MQKMRSNPKQTARKAPVMPEHATSEDRADYIVARLEKFIREGSKDEQGMSFERWKQMARSEIAIALAEAEMTQKYDELSSKRVLFVVAAAMVTIGFWGTVTSMDKIDVLAGALVCGLAGLVMIMSVGNWRYRSWAETKEARKRREILGRVESLTKRIKRLEKELETEAEELEKLKRKAGRTRLVLTGGSD